MNDYWQSKRFPCAILRIIKVNNQRKEVTVRIYKLIEADEFIITLKCLKDLYVPVPKLKMALLYEN